MKNKFYLELAMMSGLLLTSFAQADQISEYTTVEPIHRKKAEIVLREEVVSAPFIEYHNRMVVFDPIHIGYERIEPEAFYVGIEGWVTPVIGRRHVRALAESELRVGYNNIYEGGRDHLTPVIGIGVLADFKKGHHYHGHLHSRGLHFFHHKSGVFYGTLGAQYDHEFNELLDVGVNLKGLLAHGKKRKHFELGSRMVGVDVAVPVTFRFGRHRHWDFRLEPFDILLHGRKGTENFFGTRCTLGYRF